MFGLQPHLVRKIAHDQITCICCSKSFKHKFLVLSILLEVFLISTSKKNSLFERFVFYETSSSPHTSKETHTAIFCNVFSFHSNKLMHELHRRTNKFIFKMFYHFFRSVLRKRVVSGRFRCVRMHLSNMSHTCSLGEIGTVRGKGVVLKSKFC